MQQEVTTKRWQNWPSKGPKWSHWSVKMETPEAKQTAQTCFNMRNNMQNIAPQNANNWPQSAKIEATKCQKTVTAPCQSWKRNARQGNKEREKGTGIRRGNNGANKRPEKRTNLCPWWPCQSWKMKWRGGTITKNRNYFASSDPHHDISKQLVDTTFVWSFCHGTFVRSGIAPVTLPHTREFASNI